MQAPTGLSSNQGWHLAHSCSVDICAKSKRVKRLFVCFFVFLFVYLFVRSHRSCLWFCLWLLLRDNGLPQESLEVPDFRSLTARLSRHLLRYTSSKCVQLGYIPSNGGGARFLLPRVPFSDAGLRKVRGNGVGSGCARSDLTIPQNRNDSAGGHCCWPKGSCAQCLQSTVPSSAPCRRRRSSPRRVP